MSDSYTFRRADPDDEHLIQTWFRSPHVMEFWGEPAGNISDFNDAMAGTVTLFDYWIGEDDKMPFCFLAVTDAATDTPEHLAPYLSDHGDAWTLDVLIGPLEYIGRGIAANMLVSFLDHLRELNPSLTTILIDPESNNPRAINVYGKAGFKKVSTFTPADGDFKGKLHVLMAYDYGD